MIDVVLNGINELTLVHDQPEFDSAEAFIVRSSGSCALGLKNGELRRFPMPLPDAIRLALVDGATAVICRMDGVIPASTGAVTVRLVA